MKGRSKTLKYKNYIYTSDIIELLNIPLTNEDNTHINLIKERFNKLNLNRGYEYIIKDIYILAIKNNMSTHTLAEIYGVNIRTIQKWFKELGINRTTKDAKKIKSLDNHKIDYSSINIGHINLSNKNTTALPELAQDFLIYIKIIKGQSNNTVEGYKVDLEIFFKFMKKHKSKNLYDNYEFGEIPISDININFIKSIKLEDFYAFLSYLEKERDNKQQARARKIATLKSFYKYLHSKVKVINENPTLELESPKISKRHPIYLTLEESTSLLYSINKSDYNYERDYCIITLFLNCGMRLSELCNIKMNKIKNDTLTISGKGNKERTIYLNEACLKALENYIKIRGKYIKDEKDIEYLFLSRLGNPINKRTVELVVEKHIKNANLLNEKYTPHKLRHSAATMLHKHGKVDIRSLQIILGHQNVSTTQIYVHIDNENLREAAKLNPLSKIDIEK